MFGLFPEASHESETKTDIIVFAYAHIQKKLKTLASRKHPEIGDLRSGICVIPLSVGTINGTERLLGIGKLPEIKTKFSES